MNTSFLADSWIRCVLVVAGLVFGAVAHSWVYAQNLSLERRLASSDTAVVRAAIDELVHNADKAEPLLLMTAAIHLFRLGRKDEAVFWFYAGQLRARYSPNLKGENSQLIAIFTMVGGPINAYAQQDILGMEKTIGRVLKWDSETFEIWARANANNASNERLPADRAKAREGLLALIAELTTKREHFEKLAREYVSPEEQQRRARLEYAKRVEKSFSAQVMERVVDGKTLRLPANYFTSIGLEEPFRKEVRDLTLTVFLPDFSGMNKATASLDFGSDKNLMWVRINDPNENKKTAMFFDDFIATNPSIVRVFGANAYFFNIHNNPAKLSLPLHGYMNEYVFRHVGPKGDPAYMSCQAPESDIINSAPQCRLFLRHLASGLRFNATFSQTYGDRWLEIIQRLQGFLDVWYVKE